MRNARRTDIAVWLARIFGLAGLVLPRKFRRPRVLSRRRDDCARLRNCKIPDRDGGCSRSASSAFFAESRGTSRHVADKRVEETLALDPYGRQGGLLPRLCETVRRREGLHGFGKQLLLDDPREEAPAPLAPMSACRHPLRRLVGRLSRQQRRQATQRGQLRKVERGAARTDNFQGKRRLRSAPPPRTSCFACPATRLRGGERSSWRMASRVSAKGADPSGGIAKRRLWSGNLLEETVGHAGGKPEFPG